MRRDCYEETNEQKFDLNKESQVRPVQAEKGAGKRIPLRKSRPEPEISVLTPAGFFSNCIKNGAYNIARLSGKQPFYIQKVLRKADIPRGLH